MDQPIESGQSAADPSGGDTRSTGARAPSLDGLTAVPPETTEPGPVTQALNAFSSLRAKLVLPYVLLTLLLAFGGIFIVTRLVTSSVRERFVNQLYEAGRVAADGVVRREQQHLSALRLMSFTVGVPEAIERRDGDELSELLWPLALNEGVEAVVVLDENGREVVGLTRASEGQEYLRTAGSDFSHYDFVVNVLQRDSDEAGDKFVGLIETSFGRYLFTSGPVEDRQGELAGVLLVGAELQSLARQLKAQSLADVVILSPDGRVTASTLPEPEGGFASSGLLLENHGPSSVVVREFDLYGRPYQAAYAPWVVRDQVLGTMAVVLPSNFVVSAEATSRTLFSLIFALGTVAVIMIGYLLARNIANPILQLRSMAQAVAGGDLDQVSGLRRQDEIGELADAFDVMTARLSQRTEEAKRLYEEAVERNRQLAEMYDRLQTAQQQLIQSEKLAAVGQLAAGIVHDVKNPLGVIKGMAEELMAVADEEAGMGQGLKIIRDNASRANVIVTDLLKFARQSTPSMEKHDLRNTITGCLRLTDYLIRKADIEVNLSLPDRPIWVTYDAQQMEQVIINLVQNAVQAMPQGGELHVELAEHEAQAVLEVSDTGEGIPEADRSRIFEPFFTTKPEGEGTGMGLPVSYGIVSRHSGKIEVESQLGEGSMFRIVLPQGAEGTLRDQGQSP